MKMNAIVREKLKLGDLSMIPGKYKDASVFLLLTEEEDAKIIFTLRSNFLNSHANEIAFPGGIIEKDDTSLIETAYRETFEEIGIFKEDITFLGQLSRQLTLRGIRVTPYVGSVSANIKANHTPVEVTEVFYVPLKSLIAQAYNNRPPVQANNRTIRHYFTLEQHFIWGLTGNILSDFLNRCFDRQYELISG